MSTIVTRAGKGSALTHNEVDANFTNLNTDKLQSGNTAASLTITSADINGGTIDGTSIGGSSAAAGTFTSLSDSGNLTFTGTGNRITGDFSNATIANRVMFQTSTTNGITAVTAIPNGTATDARFTVNNNSDPTNSNGIQILANATEARIQATNFGTASAFPMTFYTGGSERMQINTSGNVGIGTSSPAKKLHVNGDIRLGDGGGTGAIFTDATSGLRFMLPASGTSTTEAMRIDSSGNVGIGTSSPGARLEVKGASASAGQLSIHDGTGDTTVSGVTAASLLFQARDSSVRTIAEIDAVNTTTNGTGGAIVFQTRISDTLAERMRITSGGEVYIAGTTDQGAYNLQCNGTGVWGAGAYVNGSDARIKEDVAPIASGLNVVTKLNPVTYRYKEDWSKDQSVQTGFIAQELLTALEGEVYVDGVVQQGGSEGYYSVAYQNIIPILTKAIQEQQAIIEELKAKVAALEEK